MKRKIAALLTAVMCAAMLTACGNAQNAGDTNNSGEAAQSGNAETLNSGVLKVGTNAEFPPFEYMGDDGQPDGFDIALIKAIGEKMGLEVQVENMEFDSLAIAIGSKIDAAIAGMTVTDERKETVDFSDTYYDAVQYVIVPSDSELAAAAEAGTITAADLENSKIGVQLGTTGDIVIAEEIAGGEVSTYNKAVDAVNDLVNGRVDYVIIDKNPALVFEEKFGGKVTALDGALFGFETEQYAIALPKGSSLVEKVNQALNELKADGTFDALVAQYIEQAE